MPTRRFKLVSLAAGCVVGMLGISFVAAGGELTWLGGSVAVGDGILDNYVVDEPSGVVRSYDAVSGRLVWAWEALRT